MMPRFHNLSFCKILLCCSLLFSLPLASNAQLDSLLNVFRDLQDATKVGPLFKEMGTVCAYDRDCFQDFEAYTYSSPLTPVKAQGMFLYASYYANKSLYDIGDKLFEKGLRVIKKSDQKHPLIGRFYIAMAVSFRYQNVLDSAIYYADKGYTALKQNKLDQYYWMYYKTKYLVYLDLKDYKRADQNLIQAYESADPNNRMDRGFLLHSLLLAKKERGPQSDFIKYLDEFIKFKKAGNKHKELDAEHSGLLAFFDSEEEAIKVLEERLKKLEGGTEVDISLSRLVLADKYTKNNQGDAAIEQLNKAEKEGSASTNKSLYWQKFQTYRQLNKHQQAYDAIEKYLTIQDSSYRQLLDKQIAEHEVIFKTKEKEQELVLKKAELAEAKIVQQSIFGLFLLLATLAMTFFYMYKKRQKYIQSLIAKDMTIQQQKIIELEQKNKLLSLNSMIEGQESERMRIAQDLHDGLGGLLTTVKAHFSTIQKEIENIESLNIYSKTNRLIDEACTEVRRIAHDMVPYSIKISGLHGALEDLKESVIARGLECEVEIHNFTKDQLNEQQANMVYRILQEITNNAIKHAQANHIFIQLMGHENKLHILVEDDGVGFDVSKQDYHGMGLKSINSRVAYLGGTIMYDSSPGQGTNINIEIDV